METNAINASSQKGLVDELVEGRDLTKQLYSILLKEESSSSSPNEASNNLSVTQKILSKIERSLTILRYEPMLQLQGTTGSPSSLNGSPKSPDSDGDFKDPVDCKDDTRKRKVVPRCTVRVQGCCKSGLEGPVEDGFSWRKYGQKDILGAKYHRAYYRCTQRGQGCFATKQVQRSDDDPTYFEVTYRGKHTCYQGSSSSSSMSNSPPKPEPSDAFPSPPPQEILWSFGTSPKDIKPVVTSSTTHVKSPPNQPHYFSLHHFGATQHNQSNMPNNPNTSTNPDNTTANNYLFSPNVMNNDSSSNHQHTSTTNNPQHYTDESLEIAERISFDLEIDQDFIFNNPHLFH